MSREVIQMALDTMLAYQNMLPDYYLYREAIAALRAELAKPDARDGVLEEMYLALVNVNEGFHSQKQVQHVLNLYTAMKSQTTPPDSGAVKD